VTLPPMITMPLSLLLGLLPVLLLVTTIAVSTLVSLLPSESLRKHVLKLVPQLTHAIEAVRGRAAPAPRKGVVRARGCLGSGAQGFGSLLLGFAGPQSAVPIWSAASFASAGMTWLYVSVVVRICECPRSSMTTRG
jgi:hypothetical protein